VLIWNYTRGIPRLINILCDFLLLAACSDNSTTISAALVKEIAADMGIEEHFWGETTIPKTEVSLNPAAGSDLVAFEAETKVVEVATNDTVSAENVDEIVAETEKTGGPFQHGMPVESPQQTASDGQSRENSCEKNFFSDRESRNPEGRSDGVTESIPLVDASLQEKKGFFWRLFHAVW
jgi:hypothetical protein